MPMRNKSFHYLSSSPINELEEESPMKQGIGTILTSDCEKTNVSPLRRTLSADMSSTKWFEQNGFFSPVKKIASSEELVVSMESSSVSSEDEQGYENCPGQDEFWILSHKGQNGIKKPGQMDVWGSILAQKSENCSNVSPPYVHPLVKRSSIGLSEQSIEMCTECIGSETGSDGFCSEILTDVVQEETKELKPIGDFHVTNPRKSIASPFPPPLSSISGGHGASVHMRSHRKNGRLTLEAVSVPSRNCFQAHRRDGRLLLVLIDSHIPREGREDMVEIEVGAEVFENMEDARYQGTEETVDDGGCGGGEKVEKEEEEGVAEEKFQVSARKVVQFVADQNSIPFPRVMSVHITGLMMKNNLGSRNKTMNLEDEVVVEELQIPQPLPQPPRVPRSIPSPSTPPSSFNSYEFFWRNKSAVGDGVINSIVTTSQSTPLKTNNNCKSTDRKSHDFVLMRGNKTEYFVPYLKGCKEFTRSLLIWEPSSIATS